MLDTVIPDQSWEFNSEVTAAFDDMLRRSIPQYDVMRKACFDIGRRYCKPDTWILDLGCSRGEAIKPFIELYGNKCLYLGVEVSEPMRQAALNNLAGLSTLEPDIQDIDLRTNYPNVDAALTLAILVIQFTPIEYRQRIIQNIYDHTLPGGAVIMVEKILGANADIDNLMVELYYDMKADNGYPEEAIERKRLSLEGVLVPVTAKWNEELLRMAGFQTVDCFWRWMNFAGWIAVK